MWPYKTGDLLKRFNSYAIFYERTRKMWPLITGDRLIEVTRICKSRNRQHNGQKKKDKRTNNDLQCLGTVFFSNIIETCNAGLSPTRSVAPSIHVISLSPTRRVAPSTHVIHYDQRPGFPYNNLAYHHRRPHPLSATTAGTGQLRGSNPDNNHGSPIEG